MSITQLSCFIRAPRALVYQALVDGPSVATWMVPAGMNSEVHAFEGREGGFFRISLTYKSPDGVGKTAERTDTFHGRFLKLVPGVQIVEEVEFEAADPAFQGMMKIIYSLEEAGAGTKLTATHENVPPGVDPEANETGWRMSLENLKDLVEARYRAPA